MISKKYLMDHIDNLYDEVNNLCRRVTMLEREAIKKDIKKIKSKRGPGRPPKSEGKKNVTKKK